jgi:hypothetical protein
MPQLAVDPGHTRDESIRFDCAYNGAGLGIDLPMPDNYFLCAVR